MNSPKDPEKKKERELYWMGNTKKELRQFPEDVVRLIGYALHLAQNGLKHDKSKPFKGYPGVFEIVANDLSSTYRALHALKIGKMIYVLHVFQKKSKTGISTPKEELEKIDARFKAAKKREEYNV